MVAGYSKTPLHKKLGIKDGARAAVINMPVHYFDILGPDAPKPEWTDALMPDQDFVHIFTKSRVEMSDFLKEARHTIHKDGMIWVSWPKKASKVPTDVTEDVIREVCLPMGLVDIKVCAVDEVWSGLKLVIRKELR